jgi:hypothetical protein
LQAHPTGTLAPLEFAGQAIAEHVLTKKGLTVEAVTDPEKPGSQEHPVGTLLPFELVGQATPEQDDVKNGLSVVPVT